MYLGEISDAKVRGLLGSSCSFMWIFGFLLINTIGSYLNITKTAIVSSLVPVICFFTFIWMPESPYFLLMRNRIEDAKCSLRRFRGIQNVDDEISRMKSSINTKSKNTGKFLDLFLIKSNRRAVYIVAGLRGMYNGLKLCILKISIIKNHLSLQIFINHYNLSKQS